MRNKTEGRKLLSRWGLLLSYSLLILFTLSIVRRIRDYLTTTLGEQGFSYAVAGVFGICAIIAVIWIIRLRIYEKPVQMIVLVLTSACYIYFILRLELVVERIHYIEYGLVTILAFRAIAPLFPNSGAFILSLMYVIALGTFDEGVQWILPTRVGEIRDVWINLTAGFLGLFPIMSMQTSGSMMHKPDRRTASAVLLCTGILVLSTAFFLNFVHGFGHLHTLPDGTKFKSALRQAEFRTIGSSNDAVIWEDFSRAPLSSSDDGLSNWITNRINQWRAFRHATPTAFNYEAWGHLRHRNGLENPRYAKYREAYEEQTILTSFYGTYVEKFSLSWPRAKCQRYKTTSPKERLPYESPIQELLITWINPTLFWALSVVTALGFLLSALLIRRNPITNTSSSDHTSVVDD